MTLDERVAEIAAAEGCVKIGGVAQVKKSFGPQRDDRLPVGYLAKVQYMEVVNGERKVAEDSLIVLNSGTAEEVAEWYKVPRVLQVAAGAPTYFGADARTFAEVEGVCNAKWRAFIGDANAEAIRQLNITAVDANTIRISGLFHNSTSSPVTWSPLEWVARKTNAQPATASNVVFEQIVAAG